MPPPKKKKIKSVRNKQGDLVSERVQQQDVSRRADVEEKTSLTEEKAKQKQIKKIYKNRPRTVKAALHRVLGAMSKPDPEAAGSIEPRNPRGKSYKQNVLEDKIKYEVRGGTGDEPKVTTKKKIKRDLAKEVAKKLGTKALVKGIPVVGAIAALLESKPAGKGSDKLPSRLYGPPRYRGRKYANGGRVAKYNKD